MFSCKYCNKEFSKKSGRGLHERFCNSNKNRKFISDETRKKLSLCGKKNLAKNRYENRKYYSKQQLLDLLIFVDNYKSLFSDKIYKNYKSWKNDIVRHLDRESCNLFFYLLDVKNNGETLCNNCKSVLELENYNYRDGGFSKYCSNCTKLEVWKRVKHNEERKSKFTKSMKKWTTSDKGKEFYVKLGKKNSESLKKFFSTDAGKKNIINSAKKQSIIIKEKILNGEFTPNISNSFTHWTAEIELNNEIKKFRSSWEACFYLSNPDLKYEFIRIPYMDNDINHIYIADFFDTENNILYEIKPKSFFISQKNKMDSIINYCLINNIKFIWINEYNILNYIDESKFNIEKNILQLQKMKKNVYEKIEN